MKQEINWEHLAKQRNWCAAEVWNRMMANVKPQTINDVYRRMKEREQKTEERKNE